MRKNDLIFKPVSAVFGFLIFCKEAIKEKKNIVFTD